MPRLVPLLVAAFALAGCAGMNRSVAVLPNTLDDLAARTEPLRGAGQPGDAALAARQTRMP